MTRLLQTWWPVFIALMLVQMANGLTGTLVSVTSQAQQFSPLLQGMILSAFFMGSLAGAFSAPWLIARTSHATGAVAYTLAMTVATASFAITSDPWAWVALRLVAGAAITGIFATIESWLNLSIQDKWRGRVFSVYIFIQLAGLASGQLLLGARSIGETPLFLLSGVVMFAAVICLKFERAGDPEYVETKHISLWGLGGRAPFAVLCICLSGFSWAGLMASGPALVQLVGLSDVDKAIFMAIAVFSGMLIQVPVGYLADHMDRRTVLLGLTGAAAIAALIPAWHISDATLFFFSFAFGASTFPLYAVGVALASEVLEQSERTAASALMIVFFDLGAMIAPFMSSVATAEFGANAYFVTQALPQLAFAVAILTFGYKARPV